MPETHSELQLVQLRQNSRGCLYVDIGIHTRTHTRTYHTWVKSTLCSDTRH